MLTEKQIQDISDQITLVSDLSDDHLVEFCKIANQRYRAGIPIVTDENYDFIFISELAKRIPSHPFLKQIEDEIEGFSEEKIKLPEKMLSTDKAYTWGEVEKWLERIAKFSDDFEFPLDQVVIKGT